MKHVTLGRVAAVLALAAVAVSLAFGDHDQAEAGLSRFYSQVEKADFKAARKSIDDAVRLWPSNARFWAWRGYAGSQELPSQCPARSAPLNPVTRERVQQAAADYKHALELNRRDAVAYHNLAWLDHLLGQDQEARREWEQAIANDPDTAIYHLSLGFFLEEVGDSDGAKRQYLAAIELTPSILDSPFFARYRSQFPDAAEAVLRQAMADTESRLRTGNDPILKARLGKFYLCQHDPQRASELLESAAKDLPNLPMVWFNLGEVRRLQGNQSEAWACYGRARFLDETLAAPVLRVGEMYRQAGQRNPAVENLRSATRKWSHTKPVTAAHNTRLYGGTPQSIDDLLPTTLVWYVSPCEASAAYGALAEMMPENKVYASRSRTCESLPAPHAAADR